MSRVAFAALVVALGAAGLRIAALEERGAAPIEPLALRVVSLAPGCGLDTLPPTSGSPVPPGFFRARDVVWAPLDVEPGVDLALAWTSVDGEERGGRALRGERLARELDALEPSLPEHALLAVFELPGDHLHRSLDGVGRARLEALGAELVPEPERDCSWAGLFERRGGRWSAVSEVRHAAHSALIAVTFDPSRDPRAPVLRADR